MLSWAERQERRGWAPWGAVTGGREAPAGEWVWVGVCTVARRLRGQAGRGQVGSDEEVLTQKLPGKGRGLPQPPHQHPSVGPALCECSRVTQIALRGSKMLRAFIA